MPRSDLPILSSLLLVSFCGQNTSSWRSLSSLWYGGRDGRSLAGISQVIQSRLEKHCSDVLRYRQRLRLTKCRPRDNWVSLTFFLYLVVVPTPKVPFLIALAVR